MPAELGFEEYVWTDAETIETLNRGLRLRGLHDYCGRVRGFFDVNDELWILKSVDHDSPELDILRTLASNPSPSNHTLPTEIISCGNTCLLLMPFIQEACMAQWVSPDEICSATEQYLQGLAFMHSLGVAHLDLHAENLLYASESRHGAGDLTVKAGRAYFIDFGISQRFPPIFGLTNGTTTVPFQQDLGHYPPPEGIEAVNPYAYDMYCMGEVINYFCRTTTYFCGRGGHPDVRVTPAIWALAAAFTSEDPSERPSAKHASALIRLLKIWIKMTRWLYWFLPCCDADGIELCGWYVIDWMVHYRAKHILVKGIRT